MRGKRAVAAVVREGHEIAESEISPGLYCTLYFIA
jgi:hypothetical protein